MIPELSFGSWLKRRRSGLGMTQRALAHQVGYAEVTLRKVEADELRPSRQMADKLADALQITPEERLHFVRFARDELGVGDVDLPTLTATLVTPSHPTNLPAPVTRLIGRAKELEQLYHLLTQEGVRLLTLTGAAGAGKTRLAIEAATSMVKEFRDGVFFVGLASLVDPELIADQISTTLGIDRGPKRPVVERLKNWVRTKQILLVVDNFEHVMAGAHLVAELLAAAAQLKIIVTSRERLRLYGEHEYPLLPLELPNPSALPPPEVLIRVPAVALFVQRAQAVQPGFTLTPENAWEIAQLCVRLDGLPLAIELAAARTKVLSPRAMLAWLGTGLSWLTSATRDLPARHRTLVQAIAWSYDLLDADEQLLLTCVALCPGGAGLEAVEAICGDGLSVPALDVLASLVDKSLLVYRPATCDDVRVGMLETIRAYALERLEQRGETAALRRRRADYYLALAETADRELRGSRQELWFARLDQEHDNLRATLDWAMECGEVTVGLRLCGALAWFWELRGHFGEGQNRLTAFLTQVDRTGNTPADHAAQAKALNAAGRLAFRQEDFARASALLDKSLTLLRDLGPIDELTLVYVLHNLGVLAKTQGNYELARARHTEGLLIADRAGDKWGAAWSHNGLGDVALFLEDFATADVHFARCLALRRELGDQWGIARSLNELGDSARYQDDTIAARRFYEESLALHRRMEHQGFVALVLGNLGEVLLRQGEPEKAADSLIEGLKLFHEQGNRVGAARCLAALAASAEALGVLDCAARWLAAAQSIFETSGYRMDAVEDGRFQRLISGLKNKLGSDGFDVAWAKGRAMTLDEAVPDTQHCLFVQR